MSDTRKKRVFVTRTPILTTDLVVYSVYEETGFPMSHSTVMLLDKEQAWLGRIGTRMLPEHIDALPCGKERFDAVEKHRQEQEAIAYRAILDAYPELLGREGLRFDFGEVTDPSGHAPRETRIVYLPDHEPEEVAR